MGKLVSLADLSVIVGRSERVLIEWTDEGMPCDARGGDGVASSYDTAAVVAWLIGRATAKRDATVEAERRRLLAAQATRHELELRVRQGELVDVRQFGAAARSVAHELREALLAIPSRVAQSLDPGNPQRARQLLEREVQKALAGMSDYLERLQADQVSSAGLAPEKAGREGPTQ